MEFIISTDLGTALPSAIDFNFEQIKAELEDRLTYYNNLVVTQDSIKNGKTDRASLNALKTAIDSKRKAVKSQCLAPYEVFELKCKELTGMLDKAISSVDLQVKAFEEIEKNDKRIAIEQYFNENAGDLLELVPIAKIWDIKWLNKGEGMDKVTASIDTTLVRVRNDISVIRTMHLECEDVVLDTYLNTLDMSSALAEKERFERRQEALRKASEATRAVEVVSRPPEPMPEPIRAVQIDVTQPEQVKTVDVRFFDTTPEFRADMKKLCDQHSIKYGSVK